MQSCNPRKHQEKTTRASDITLRSVGNGPGVISRLSVSQQQQLCCLRTRLLRCLCYVTSPSSFFFSFLKKKLAPPFFPVVRCLLTINGHNRNRKLASRLKCLRWCGCVCRGENHRCLKNEKKNKTEKRYPEREREQEKEKKKKTSTARNN
jgi:hypothetical protein